MGITDKYDFWRHPRLDPQKGRCSQRIAKNEKITDTHDPGHPSGGNSGPNFVF